MVHTHSIPGATPGPGTVSFGHVDQLVESAVSKAACPGSNPGVATVRVMLSWGNLVDPSVREADSFGSPGSIPGESTASGM